MTLGVSLSAHYQRLNGNCSDRQIEDARLLALIQRLHAANYFAYGYRRMHKLLLREGERVGRDRVKRLMATNDVRGAKNREKKPKTTTPAIGARRLPDLVDRDFQAKAPNELWCVDFTYIKPFGRDMYFAFVIDVFSRMFIGWNLADHKHTNFVTLALKIAIHKRNPKPNVLVHHSDHGSQYLSYDYTQILADNRIAASVGSVGDAYDNALAESAVDSFKTEYYNDRAWANSIQLEIGITKYIGWFNNHRLHGSLNDIPPLEYEQKYYQQRNAKRRDNYQ